METTRIRKGRYLLERLRPVFFVKEMDTCLKYFTHIRQTVAASSSVHGVIKMPPLIHQQALYINVYATYLGKYFSLYRVCML